MVNKRGFLKIVEATIAVMLVLTSLIIISAQQKVPQSKDLTSEIPPLLEEIARNLSLRKEIANGGEDLEEDLENKIKEGLGNPTLNVAVSLCGLDEPCFLEPYPDTDGEIYSAERVISGSLKVENVDIKKVRVYMWRN